MSVLEELKQAVANRSAKELAFEQAQAKAREAKSDLAIAARRVDALLGNLGSGQGNHAAAKASRRRAKGEV